MAFAVLALLAGPLYLLFTTSAKTVFSARDLQTAADLAGTTLAALASLPPGRLRPAGPAPDASLGDLAPEALGVAPAPPGWIRTLALDRVDEPGASWFVARVTVRYPSPASGRTLEFAAGTLLPAPAAEAGRP